MSQILCSTGALIGRPNNRDYTLLKELAGKLECDGFEFMMYESWYDQVDRLVAALKEFSLHIPVMHCEKHIGEAISAGGRENREEAFRRYRINCDIAEKLDAGKLVIHLWDGITSDSHFENNLEAFGELRKIAESRGIDLLVENAISGDISPILSGQSEVQEDGILLKFSMERVYEYRSTLNGSILTIEWYRPEELFDFVVVLDPAGSEEHAERNGDRNDQHKRHRRQPECHGQLVPDQLRHRHHLIHILGISVTVSEITLQYTARPAEIPDNRRLVQTQLFPKLFLPLGSRFRSQNGCHDIPGNDLESEESRHGNQEQCHNESQNFFYNVFHAVLSSFSSYFYFV